VAPLDAVKNTIEIQNFSSPDALAKAAASAWVEILRGVSADKPFLVALSGGRIAKNLFNESSKLLAPLAQAGNLKHLHFFWADERCVPPDNAESNFAMAEELCFKPLGVNESQIHRIRGEQDPLAAAAMAEQELRAIATHLNRNQPAIDLIFLGMGEDGHTASLFPQESSSMVQDPAVYRSVVATKPPPERVTLGYQALLAAKNLWVLASGKGKEQALEKSLAFDGDTPLARVLKGRGSALIFSDIPLRNKQQGIS
jgi:6-phosphogluconolactonase